MIYKYSLEKYSGPKSRYICPNCGQKDFVRYVHSDLGSHVGDSYGRCNRIEKCGYHSYPDSSKNNNSVDLGFRKSSVSTKNHLMTYYFDRSDVLKSLHSEELKVHSDLFSFISSYFGSVETLRAFRKYGVGVSSTIPKAVIFWQIDMDLNIRAGKIMKYNKRTGSRDHNFFSWVKKNPSSSKSVQQCFFGFHLVNKYPNFRIAIVESEKTALICSLYYGSEAHIVWLASGGLQGLQDHKFRGLENRSVILFPDLSALTSKINAFEIWTRRAQELRSRFDIDIAVNSFLEYFSCEEDREAQLDLADFIIRHLAE